MSRGVLATLRDLAPPHPLSQGEALRVAELQAERLLELAGISGPWVPEKVITDIPKIEIRRIRPWPVPGCTDWAKGTWVIVINAADIPERQRFTLAHEFKHIVDYRSIDVLYPPNLGMSSRERAEGACDYFAGCLLVPESWLKASWDEGCHDVVKLAARFNVSKAAMKTRLSQVGLVKEVPGYYRETPSSWRYMRSTPHVLDTNYKRIAYREAV